MRKVKTTLCQLSEYTYSILRGSLLLSCTLLFSALLLLLRVGEVTVHNFDLYLCALDFIQAPAGLLLFATVISLCIEDRSNT